MQADKITGILRFERANAIANFEMLTLFSSHNLDASKQANFKEEDAGCQTAGGSCFGQ